MGTERIPRVPPATDRTRQVPEPRPRPIVQAKLTVGPAGDHYEQEADQVAAAVMRELRRGPPALSSRGADLEHGEPDVPPAGGRIRPAHRPDSATPGELRAPRTVSRIRRALAGPAIGAEGGALDAATDAAFRSARGGGRPLDAPVRQSMEHSFGSDFSGVRVHTDRAADELNRRIQATASTTGRDIFFSRGQYNPTTAAGQSLLAHELTHVVQQGAAGPADAATADGQVARRLVEGPPTAVTDGVLQRLRLQQAGRDIEEDQMTLKAEYNLARDQGRNEDLVAIMQLQSSTAVRSESIMMVPTAAQVLEALEGDEIAAGIYVVAGGALAQEFHDSYDPGRNPAIPLALMIKLRKAGCVGIHAAAYRQSAGGQNGMTYLFCIRGFERRSMGEWHVHWEAGKKAGTPGWKRGKNGEKTATGDEMRPLLGDLWGVVKNSGSGNWD